MAVLDYIDEYDIIFGFLQNFNGNPDSYALEILPERARQALKVLEEGKAAADELSENWGYSAEDILYVIEILTGYFKKLVLQTEISVFIFEIY